MNRQRRRSNHGKTVRNSDWTGSPCGISNENENFLRSPTAFGGAPNTHTCPVCTGMPGSLPVLNKQVVEYAMAVGLALNCDINQYCKFDRKTILPG